MFFARSITHAVNFDDLHAQARRHLPKIVFDFIEGGVDGEEGLGRNTSAFAERTLVPRYGIQSQDPDLSITLFGRRYAKPFGIAPTGAIGLFRRGGDVMLARAARDADIPFIQSGMSSASIEEVGAVAPEHAWFQLYVAGERRIAWDMVARADDAGFQALVVTMDIPGSVKRERNLKNGISGAKPLSPSLKGKIEALRHPSWLADYFGGPGYIAANWAKYAPAGANAAEIMAFVAKNLPTAVTWDDIAEIRKRWPRALVVKGIMHPADALRAANLGVDGILVSNHGGRQLDRSVAPIDVLPAIRDAVGDQATVLVDSGIRRGADIVTALALGAKACFVGRWTLYGLVAGGEAGAAHAVSMIRDEVATVMTQLGTPSIAAIGPDCLMWDDRDPRRNTRA